MPSKQPIAFYFDIFSPFGYLASTQIEKIAARHGRDVDWRPVLVGITVLKVMGMKPLPTYPLKGPYLNQDGHRFAQIYGVPYKPHGLKGHNSLAAMRAFNWIKSFDAPLAVEFAKRMYAKLWVEGVDITPVEVSADVAAGLGIDREKTLAALASDEVKQGLTAAVNDAIEQGVFGVPFFIADGEKFFGNDHIWMMERWLKHGRWSPQDDAQSG
jgi:2-hydroxychromene-2-carboxylate isomerase